MLSWVLPPEGARFWLLVCMGAILDGTMRSPLAGVVFSLELTHDDPVRARGDAYAASGSSAWSASPRVLSAHNLLPALARLRPPRGPGAVA